MVKNFLKLFYFQGVIIFINNAHKKEFAIKNLLTIQNQKCFFVYKSVPIYKVYEDKIVLNNLLFFIFSLILGLKFKNKFIMIFSQPYYAIPYIFLGNMISIYFYDVHIGLLYIKKWKLLIEKISILFFKNIIHRDLRLWVEYKKLLKKNFRKNILIPDYILHEEQNNSKKLSDNIKCAVIGWADDNYVKVDESVKHLAHLGVEIYFFTSKSSFDLSVKNYLNDTQIMKKIHYVGYRNSDEFKNILKDFSIGLCPHDAKNPKLSKNYRSYCSSMRIIDYIQSYLTVFLSNKVIFQKFILKKYNANYHVINKLKTIKSINELKVKINIKNITYNNSIFNKSALSKKLVKFLILN